LAEIAQALNHRGSKTNRGSQFTPTQIHRLLKAAYTSKEYELARTALEVRISEDQSAAAEKLERQTHTLIRLTTRLYYLTWGLLALTAGLLGFTIWLVIRH